MTAYDDIRTATDVAESQHIQVVQMLAEAGDTIAEQAATITGLLAENEELKKALADCEAGHPPDPEPPTGRVLRVGACPSTGGINGPAGAVTKWGAGIAVRLFDSGQGLSFVPARPAGVARMHASWKVLGSTLTTAAVVAACRNLVAGDSVTVEHEHDVKFKKDGNRANLDERMRLIEQFHSIIKAERPDLVTECVLAGWRFHPTDSTGPDMFLCESDVIGADLDGVNTSYTDWTRCLPKIIQIAERDYNGRWSVPEYGWPRLSGDTNGAIRVAAINAQTPKIIAAGPESLIWFDIAHDGSTYPLTLPNEKAAWQTFIDAHKP